MVFEEKLQDKSPQIESIVRERLEVLGFLQKFYEKNETPFSSRFGNILIDTKDILEYNDKSFLKSISMKWFTLALSLSKIMKIDTAANSIRGLAQLFVEYEYFTSSSTIQNMKILLARNDGYFPDSLKGICDDNEASVSTSLHKVDNHIQYEFLQVPHIPGSLDYLDIVFNLTQVLQQIYRKMMDPSVTRKNMFEAFISIDCKIQEYIITSLIKDLKKVSLKIIDCDFNKLRDIDSNIDLYNFA